MKEDLEQIRTILNRIEAESASASELSGNSSFAAHELPQVIQEIVDDLQPLLSPYESAFYWYAFRHSIAKNGNPHVRLSGRGIRHGVVQSSRSRATKNTISEGKVREIYRALETIGAIRKEGEANRDGTPYRVLIPDEIE